MGRLDDQYSVTSISVYRATKDQRPLTSRNIQFAMIIVQDSVYNMKKNHASKKSLYKLRKIQFDKENLTATQKLIPNLHSR